jgi:hypothetical protein
VQLTNCLIDYLAILRWFCNWKLCTESNVKVILDNKFKVMWKEAVVACFKIVYYPSTCLLGTEKNHRKYRVNSAPTVIISRCAIIHTLTVDLVTGNGQNNLLHLMWWPPPDFRLHTKHCCNKCCIFYGDCIHFKKTSWRSIIFLRKKLLRPPWWYFSLLESRVASSYCTLMYFMQMGKLVSKGNRDTKIIWCVLSGRQTHFLHGWCTDSLSGQFS